MNAKRSLDSQVFMIVLLVGALTALVSTVFTFIEGYGPGASITTMLCFVASVIIFVVAFVFDKEAICHVLLCVVLNIFLIPMAFFYCGGLRSGMTMYFITCLYVVVPCIAKRWVRAVVYIGSLLAMVLAVFLAIFILPEEVTPVSPFAWSIDVIVSLVINAFCIYYVASLTVRAYEREHESKEALLQKLENMTVHDELTGLYNRRELFRVMEEEVMEAREDDNYQVFMFDIDDFKGTNDTLGHVFGDRVLRSVADVLGEIVHEEDGEIAARYSGEEFVAILHCAEFDEAYEKAEQVRKSVEELRFRENPDYTITISGGVDRCNGIRPRLALRHVDELLYIAKQAGKNQITRGE